MRKSTLSARVAPLVLALVYFAAARLSLDLAFSGSNASPIWPPTGIAIAALALWGLRLAPAVAIAAFVANLLSFSTSQPDLPLAYWLASATIALGNTAEALAGAWILRRDPEAPRLFHSQSSVLRFLLAVPCVSAISALVGVITLTIAGIIPTSLQTTVGLTWWIGDVCGALVIVPAIVAWAQPATKQAPAVKLRDVAGLLLTLGTVTLIAAVIFGPWITSPAWSRPLVLPIFIGIGITAWRYGLRGASVAVVLIAACAVLGTTRGLGPFATQHLNESLVLLDSFIAILAAAALFLAADRLERRREGFANRLREYGVPGLVLFGSLTATVFAWHLLALDNEQRGERRFKVQAEDLADHIADRMQDYQRLLRAGTSLFAASESISRQEWQTFHQHLQLHDSLPGIQGLGFTIHIPAGERDALIRKIRQQGFPNFTIKPAGERPEYTAIIYLEPFDRRNQRAFGFDMMTESTRRTAMVRARDTGQTSLSAKVILLQEDGTDVQPGVLMFEPLYRGSSRPETIEGRRAALRGFVYAPFRTRDLMQGMLGDHWPGIWLDVYDGSQIDTSHQLYAHARPANLPQHYRPRFGYEKKIDMFGHAWTLRMQSSPAFEAGIDYLKSQFVFLFGGMVSLLLFATVRMQVLTGARASRLAEAMTVDLRHVQSEVEAREHFANTIFAATPEPLLLVDSTGHIVRANAAAESTFGYTNSELLALEVEALIPQPMREQHAQRRHDFVDRGEARPMGVGRELTALRADGSIFPAEIALAPIRFSDTPYIVVSIVDVSNHKQTEAELRRLSALNTAILDSAAVSVITTDNEGMITSFNQGAEQLLGYRAEEMVGRCTPALIHDIDEVVARAASFSQEIGETIAPGFEVFVAKTRRHLPNTHEWTYLRKDGSRIPVLLAVTALRGRDDMITGFLGVAVDISERKAAEAAVREQQHFLSLIADNIPGLVGYWDSALRCHFANRAYFEWFGKTPQELNGMHVRDVLGEKLFAESLPYMEAALAGAIQQFERAILKPDGSIGLTYSQYIPDLRDGQVQGFIAVVTDITSLKQTQVELEKRNAELLSRSREAEAANRAKSDFLANMSHEIRTPMNAVIGLSQLLEDSALNERQRDYLQRIQSASRALLGVLNDILDYSKIEAGHLQIETVDFRLEDVFKSIADLFAVAASEKEIELLVAIGPEVPAMINGDPLRLGQVLQNLVGNAIKFTERGEIQLTVQSTPETDGTLSLEFTVRDSGIGIAPEEAQRLFNPFEQADTSTTRKYGGTGLGLSICKRLTELMGGTIGVSSTTGQGSTFHFNIRVRRAARAIGEPAPELRPMHTLIVDDQIAVLQVIEPMLARWNYRCTVLSTPDEVLPHLHAAADRGDPYELVLLDWQMPGMDGLEIARSISTQARQGALPGPYVIMITAHGRDHLLQARGDVRIDAVLEKPILPSQLHEILAALHTRRPSPAAAGEVAVRKPWEAKVEAIRGGKILLVEDNPTNQLVALELLRRMGMHVDVANHGQEAVTMVGQKHYDLILMDLQMPVMDGFAATAAIRANGSQERIPIVAMTAAAMVKDKAETRAAGMDGHLSKPIEIPELVDTLVQWLPQGRRDDAPPPAPAETQTQGFCLAGLDIDDAVRRAAGDWNLLRSILRSFADDFSTAVADLDQQLAAGDFASATRLVHTIKGLALNIGATALYDAARLLESELQQGRAQHRQAFDKALEAALAAIAALPPSSGTSDAAVTRSPDLAAITPQLAQLEKMLEKRQGKARQQAAEIAEMLGGTTLQGKFAEVHRQIDKLKFNEARHALQNLLSEITRTP